jgi:hypothetical protein
MRMALVMAGLVPAIHVFFCRTPARSVPKEKKPTGVTPSASPCNCRPGAGSVAFRDFKMLFEFG